MFNSYLYITNPSAWPELIVQFTLPYNPADIWLPEDIYKPITILQAREAKLFAASSPVGEGKIIIIPSFDQAQQVVANTLLKMLEEPPDFLKIYLIAETERLLPTILSRVRVERQISAKIDEGESSERDWRQALKKQNLDDVAQRDTATKLLYLASRRHHSIKSDIVLDPYQ